MTLTPPPCLLCCCFCTGGKVIDATAAIASTGYKVLVMDTGVEKTHPDLNVVEFIDYVDEPGTADHGVDGHGHGTHVGGELQESLWWC